MADKDYYRNHFSKFDFLVIGFLLGAFLLGVPYELYLVAIGFFLGRCTNFLKKFFDLE